ncbi:unnamed protein product [Moneuplotes crassus]|uniref:DOMON domain-containing protein n=1 Tax=Euplotes crassus TaxID=5936 RepID=A0AAD1XUQ2_EUPCR|nr:unnamed protein product [Moneuplotes crassus]
MLLSSTLTIYCASLVSGSGYDVSLKITASQTDSTLTDATLSLETPSAIMTDSFYSSFICFDVGVANYSLSNDTTNIPAFGIEYHCASKCTSIEHADDAHFYVYAGSGSYKGGTFSLGTDGMVKKTSIISNATKDETVRYQPILIRTFYNLSVTTLADLKLPNQSQTAYFRCFARFDHADTASLDLPIVDIGALLTTKGNATIHGSSAGSFSLLLFTIATLTAFLCS